MKKTLFSLLALAGTSMMVAQLPAPPSGNPAAATTVTGGISQFNYGPDGRVAGFVIAPNTLVALPADLAIEVELLAKTGDEVSAAGLASPAAASGMQILQPQKVTVAGRTLLFTEPSPPAPYAGAGVIRSLNYGRGGEINGFVLQNGVIALTPPMGMNDFSVVKPGASIAVSGFAHSTVGGKTVVEVQSITANGQTIAMNTVPRGRPDREGPNGGPGRERGPRDAAPPPPDR